MPPSDPHPAQDPDPLRVHCDAMFGGLARWLRLLGVDTRYVPGIEDARLVREARLEHRLIISSDRRLFERRAFVRGEVRGLLLPAGLDLIAQVRRAVAALDVRAGPPRCTACNGELQRAWREEVADRVPARTLIWGLRFHRCADCGQVFWEGTHWRRIRNVLCSLNLSTS